jgi:hypothetical protein
MMPHIDPVLVNFLFSCTSIGGWFSQMQYLIYWMVFQCAVDPANNDAKMKLAEIYEIMGEPRKALDIVYEGN